MKMVKMLVVMMMMMMGGPEMGFMQSLALGKKMFMWLLGIPLVPIFCVIFIMSPKSKVHVYYASLFTVNGR